VEAIKQMLDEMATADDNVPGDVLILLEEDSLRQMTQLINNIHENRERPKDFIEVTLKKKPKATK
jgi:hypothetical protein